jgi:hypothetical protein
MLPTKRHTHSHTDEHTDLHADADNYSKTYSVANCIGYSRGGASVSGKLSRNDDRRGI